MFGRHVFYVRDIMGRGPRPLTPCLRAYFCVHLFCVRMKRQRMNDPKVLYGYETY
jgi:hypothetical protein